MSGRVQSPNLRSFSEVGEFTVIFPVNYKKALYLVQSKVAKIQALACSEGVRLYLLFRGTS